MVTFFTFIEFFPCVYMHVLHVGSSDSTRSRSVIDYTIAIIGGSDRYYSGHNDCVESSQRSYTAAQKRCAVKRGLRFKHNFPCNSREGDTSSTTNEVLDQSKPSEETKYM